MALSASVGAVEKTLRSVLTVSFGIALDIFPVDAQSRAEFSDGTQIIHNQAGKCMPVAVLVILLVTINRAAAMDIIHKTVLFAEPDMIIDQFYIARE